MVSILINDPSDFYDEFPSLKESISETYTDFSYLLN